MIKKELVQMISAITAIICWFSSIIFFINKDWYLLLLTFTLFVVFVVSRLKGIIYSVSSIKEKTKYKALDFVVLILNIINIMLLLIIIFVFIFIFMYLLWH